MEWYQFDWQLADAYDYDEYIAAQAQRRRERNREEELQHQPTIADLVTMSEAS